MRIESFSPRQFLKARRPERFSDSVVEQRPTLDRPLLEYHLDTLTSRSQETDFEHFALRLAQCEVCPNLLPHTGPTGGGDSKVDAETYPIADALSLVWYIGSGTQAATERWAFAFSAKKDWRGKLQSDIAKIAGTRRKYKKIFFVSNQFVPDKLRGQQEDTLRRKHKIDVRILDRSWILDRVFEGGHQEIAIKELKLSTLMQAHVRKGPLDLQRQDELDEIELRIKKASEEGRFSFQLVTDCIQAATLARSLDLPRTEIEGRFARAQRVAKEHGTQHQQLLAAYELAWTTFWWFEDFKQFGSLYEEVEKHAKGTLNAYELELLTNLWINLYAAVDRGSLDKAEAKLDTRASLLAAELERLRTQNDRPSTALQAETSGLLMQFMLCRPKERDPVLQAFERVIRLSKGLLGFPLEPLLDVLTDMGDVVGDSPAYNQLFETTLETAKARKGEIVAARILLRRGAQLLDSERPYEAIRSVGRALGGLYKHESRDDFVRALYLCGSAYERVGLLWAARGALLTAAAVAAREFWSHSEFTSLQAACFNRLKWLELRLGRVPHCLACHELDRAVTAALAEKGYAIGRLNSGTTEFDVITGMLFLKADLWQLKQLSRLPDVLDDLGLSNSSIALRFALGPDDEFLKNFEDVAADDDGVVKFFAMWRDQPAAEELPPSPSLYEARKVHLKSCILGCKINVESENSSPCLELAESVLAALEALLATGLDHKLFAREPLLMISFRKSDFAHSPFVFQMKDQAGRPHVEVSCTKFSPHSMSKEEQKQVKDKLFELLIHILARVFLVQDVTQLVVKLFGDELALQRSIDFTSSFVTSGNVLGCSPKTTIEMWSDPKARDYTLKRSEEWDAADRRAEARPRANETAQGASSEPKSGLTERRSVKHTEIETVSLIRERLWDRASWSGTGYFLAPDDSVPPIVGLLFKDADAAGEIFSEWRKELGTADTQERLRLTIIRGISVKNPFAYRLLIGTNPTIEFFRQGIRYLMISRLNTMDAASEVNLDNFLNSFKSSGVYLLAHAILLNPSSEPRLVEKDAIVKRELHVREAWEIGLNDIDSAAFRGDDHPIIPSEKPNAPVIELLAWVRSQQRSA